MRRKTAVVLCVVMTAQALMTGGTLPVLGASGAANGKEITFDVTENGTPREAFSGIIVRVKNRVLADGDIGIGVDAELDEVWLNQKYETFIDKYYGLDETDFDDGYPLTEGGDTPANEEYDTYDEYLNSIGDTVLPALSFGFTIQKGLLDDSMDGTVEAIMADNGEKSEQIGSWSIKRLFDGKFKVQVELDKILYYRQNIQAGFSKNLGLQDYYEPGTDIGKGEDGDADITLSFGESETATDSDAEYTLEKSAQVSDRKIVYEIVATASASNAEPEALALQSDVYEDGEESSGDRDMDSLEEVALLDDVNGTGYSMFDGGFRANGRSGVRTGGNLATSANLVGKEIRDTLPGDLELLAVSAKIATDSSWTVLERGTDYTYDEDTRLLVWEIGQDLDADTDLISYAALRMETQLTDERYNEFLLDGGSRPFSQYFPNRAFLKGGEDGDTIKASNRVNPEVELEKFLKKENEEENGNIDAGNGTFKWMLSVNAHFNDDGVQLWVVDHIEDVYNTHNYDIENGIILEHGGQRESRDVMDGGKINGGAYAYDELFKVGQIRELISGATPSDAYYFEYEAETSDAGSTRVDGLLLIPLTGKYLDGSTKIRYSTVIGDEFLSNPDNYSQEIKFRNEAKLLWRWPDGAGVGEHDGGAEIDKEITIRLNLVEKTGEYNPADNTVTWDFTVNRLGLDADMVFKDVFKDEELELILADEGIKLSIIPDKGHELSTNIAEKTASSSDMEAPYYTLTKNPEESTTTLEIHFGETKDSLYKFQLTTGVKKIHTNAGNMSVHNEASVTAAVADKEPITGTDSADVPVKNIFISKTVEQPYDYTNHTVTWKVVINQNQLKIGEAAVTDLLPEGMEFYDWESITAIKNSGGASARSTYTIASQSDADATVWTASKDTSADTPGVGKVEMRSDPLQVLNFGFGNIAEQYELVFSTKVVENKRQEFKTGITYPFVNKATLNGNWNGNKLDISDSAVADTTPDPLKKNGRYIVTEDNYTVHDPTGDEIIYNKIPILRWEIYVNRAQADLKGAVIQDTLPYFMELIPETLKVYKVNLQADGTVPVENGTVSKLYGTEINSGHYLPDTAYAKPTGSKEDYCKFGGFQYTIPEEYAKDVILITYDTMLVEDAFASEMENTVSVKGGWSDSVDSEKADGAKDFFVDSYSSVQGVYYIKIHKTSENRDGRFPLSGAEFQLEKMEYTGDSSGDRKDWKNWEIIERSQVTKQTNRRGNLNFFFLKADTLYRITETKAPDGYVIAPKTWYLVPKLIDSSVADFPTAVDFGTETDPLAPEMNYQYSLSVNTKKESEKGDNYLKEDIENDVKDKGGEFGFKKLGQNGQILPGAEFTIAHSRLTNWATTSDAEGVVTFTGLDPLTSAPYYTITETKAPAGYKASGIKISLDVKVDDDGNFKPEVRNREELLKAGSLKTDSNGQYYVINDPIRGGGYFTKVDQNGVGLADVEFQLYRRGDGGQKLGRTGGEQDKDLDKISENGYGVIVDVDSWESGIDTKAYLPYLPQETVTSDAAGKVALSNLLYGDYRLEEILPESTEDGSTAVEVYFSIDANGKAVFRNITGEPVVENTLKYGCVQIKKVVGNWTADGNKLFASDSPRALEGAEFEIYRALNQDNSLQKNQKPVLTLTTDENGNFSLREQNEKKALIAGVRYLLRESKAPAGYALDGGIYPFVPQDGKVTWLGTGTGMEVEQGHVVDDGKTVVTDPDKAPDEAIVFPNSPAYYAPVKLQKQDSVSGILLHGAEFEVWTDKISTGESTGRETASVKVARLKEVSNTGTYTLKKGESGFETADALGQNYLKYVENAGNTNDGDASGWYLLPGTYYIREVKAPEGYKLPDSGDVWYFTLNSERGIENRDLRALIGSEEEKTFTNAALLADVTAGKRVETFRKGAYRAPETGESFAFELIPHKADKSPEEAGTMKAEVRGPEALVRFEKVPMGSYILREKLTEEQKAVYRQPEDVKVTVTYEADNENPGNWKPVVTYGDGNDSAIIDNNRIRGEVKAWKYTSESTTLGQPIKKPLMGAEYRLTGLTNPKLVLDAVTNPEGYVAFKDVPAGRYSLEEVKAPEGYIRSSKTVVVEVTADGETVTADVTGTMLEFENTPIRGYVRLEKVDAEDRAKSLRGAEFTVYDKQGAEVCRLTATPSEAGEGYVYTLPEPDKLVPSRYLSIRDGRPALFCGEYVLKETKAEAGYLLDKEEYPIKIDTDGQVITVANSEDGTFANQLAKGMITIEKWAEDEDGTMRTGAFAKGFRFRIFGASDAGVPIEEYLTEDDITGASKVEVRKEGLNPGIYVETGSEGTVELREVRVGSYHVTEEENSKTDENGSYILDAAVYDVRIEKNLLAMLSDILGSNMTVKTIKVENHLKRGDISGLKVTDTNAPLAGAVMGLFPENAAAFTEADLYHSMKAVSGDDGRFVFHDVPHGTYKVAELQAPNGYNLNRRTVFLVQITADGQTVTDGYLVEPNKDLVSEPAEIIVVNNKKSNGGGDGGGSGPTKPDPVNPTEPTGPTEPSIPESSVESTEPTEPTLPDIPVTPDGRPDIPPNTEVEVRVPNSSEAPVYHGTYNPDVGFPDVEPGVYELVTIDDEGVPLAGMLITIDDEGVPLALPKTGDNSIPAALLAVALIGAAAGIVMLRRKREEE